MVMGENGEEFLMHELDFPVSHRSCNARLGLEVEFEPANAFRRCATNVRIFNSPINGGLDPLRG